MKSFRLKSRKLRNSCKLRKGGNGPSSSSSSENYTNEKFDELLSLLSQFAFMSDEDINENKLGFKPARLNKLKAERDVTINEIKIY